MFGQFSGQGSKSRARNFLEKGTWILQSTPRFNVFSGKFVFSIVTPSGDISGKLSLSSKDYLLSEGYKVAELNNGHFVKGQYSGGFCSKKKSYFERYAANESENQGGVSRCDQCGEVVDY